MLTVAEIMQIERQKIARRQPSEEELRRIPVERPARIFGRLSDPRQIQESLQSMAELIDLVKLARQDGFRTEISEAEVTRRVNAIQHNDSDAIKYWIDGQLIVDLRDLGISGRLGPDKRPALAEFMADLTKGEGSDVTGTVYLSSEGLSRLTRDQDRIVSAQLIKLMKEANCRVRTPFTILNPRIEADWRELREGFEDAAKESRHLQKDHFGPRKRAKALKGEHVGHQVPPGFIIHIKGYKSDGKYIFGKWLLYPPHAEIVIRIFQEYIRNRGGKYRTANALRGTLFPLFPPELKYMENRSVLRNCPKTAAGYIITPEMIDGLTKQVALIGTWKWTDVIIENNHPAVVPLDLFREAYELNLSRGNKPRGRASYFEPYEWSDLLQCMNHDTPRRICGHPSKREWFCDLDYHNGTGPVCITIRHEILSVPLTKEFLKCLDLGTQADAVFDELKTRTQDTDEEQARRKREETQLKSRLANLENYLGAADPDLEESYRRQIRQVKSELLALRQKPLPQPIAAIDIDRVRRFLGNLEQEWQNLSHTLRNRLLKLLVDHVEITHNRQQIQAVIFWKMGFRQKLVIERPLGTSAKELWWKKEQDDLLRLLYPNSTKEVLQAAFPDRVFRAIRERAMVLGIKRQIREYPDHWKPWMPEDDARLRELYVKVPTSEVAKELGRSESSVDSRAWFLKVAKPKEVLFPRPKPVWESYSDYAFIGSCS